MHQSEHSTLNVHDKFVFSRPTVELSSSGFFAAFLLLCMYVHIQTQQDPTTILISRYLVLQLPAQALHRT